MSKQHVKTAKINQESESSSDFEYFEAQIKAEEDFDKKYDIMQKVLEDIKQYCIDNNADLFENTTTSDLLAFVNKQDADEEDKIE